MKIINVLYVSGVAFVLFVGCESSDTIIASRIVPQSQSIKYWGPKVRAIVSPIVNRVKSSTGEKFKVDLELTRDQLITALTRTGVFTVVRTNERTSSNGASLQGAQYLIEAVLTEYEPSQAHVRKRNGSILDNIMEFFDVKQDRIAMNIHLVVLRTNEIVDSATIEAYPKDFEGSSAGISGNITTPMQKAIRACMDKAGAWAAKTVISRESQQLSTTEKTPYIFTP